MSKRHAFRPTALDSLEDRVALAAGVAPAAQIHAAAYGFNGFNGFNGYNGLGFGSYNPYAAGLQQTLRQVNNAYANFNHSFVNLYNRSANPRAAFLGYGPGMPGFNAQVQNQLTALSYQLTAIASRLPNGSTALAPNYQGDVALAANQGASIPFVGVRYGGISPYQYQTQVRQAIGLSQYAATQDTYAYYASTFGYRSPFIDPNFPANVFGPQG